MRRPFEELSSHRFGEVEEEEEEEEEGEWSGHMAIIESSSYLVNDVTTRLSSDTKMRFTSTNMLHFLYFLNITFLSIGKFLWGQFLSWLITREPRMLLASFATTSEGILYSSIKGTLA